MSVSRHSVSLRTYALAFAVALSPALTQTNELTCTPPTGDTTLSMLELEVAGQNRIAFSSGQENYVVSISSDSAILRAQPTDPAARVSYQLSVDGHLIEEGQMGVGGGETTVGIPLGQAALRIMVVHPGNAVGHYIIDNRFPTDFVAEGPVSVSGDSVFAQCAADSGGGVFAADSEVESWIAVNPTDPNHLAVVWQQDRYLSGGGSRGHVVAISFDGGLSWAAVTIPGLTPCSGGAWDRTTDPWLAFAVNGDLYAAAMSWSYANIGGAIVVNRSTDGGLTWGNPVIVDEVTNPPLNDKESITADPVDPCTLYVTWSQFPSDSMVPGDILFSRTADCGATWAAPTIVQSTDPFSIGSQIVVLADGQLLAFYRDAFSAGTSPIYVERSVDGGLTWPDDPVVIADTNMPLVFSPDGALVRSSIFDVAMNRETEELYVVWELSFGIALQVALSSSSDGGFTWSAPIRIDDTPANSPFTLEQAFIPSVEVSNDGTVGVTYYNFQNDVAGALPSLSDYWFVSCHPKLADCGDGGSWSAAVRLTPDSFDYALAPLVTGGSSGLFLGDYVGFTSSGSDFFALFSATTEDDPANAIFVPIRAQ